MRETKTFTEVLLRNRNKIDVRALCSSEYYNLYRVSIMMKNINALGYTFSKSLFNYLINVSDEELDQLYLELVPCLKEYTGADKTWNPMYPNFPKQVEDMEEKDLYMNAIIHYLSYGTFLPVYEKIERLPLFEHPDLIVLDYAEPDENIELLTNLITSKTSLSNSQIEDMISLLNDKYLDVKETDLPDVIPFKENVAVICKTIKDNKEESEWFNYLSRYLKTATDVLRFVTYMSDGDVSLATDSKYKHLSNPERRLIMNLLSSCNNLEEDMKRYSMKWIRLGEIIHPNSFKNKNNNKYKYVIDAYDKIRNDIKSIKTFKGKLNNALENSAFDEAMTLLKSRPGEFARILDYILRIFEDKQEEVINEFRSVSYQVSVPVLLQVKEHFTYRNNLGDSRVFFPKGQLAKCYTIENKLNDISKEICIKLVSVCNMALVQAFKAKEPLGKVYISDSMKGYCIPQSQRSASKSLKQLTRNSRLPIKKDTKSCRGFIWWTNMNNDFSIWSSTRVDLDLSAAVLNEKFEYLTHVSYTNLKSDRVRGCHSGDITNGGPVDGKGVCEFIDVDIDSVVNSGGRYIIYQVYSFTGQKFSQLPNAMFGWMERSNVNSGEIFEPSTVMQKIDLTSDTTTVIPVLFDCVAKEFIWMDIAAKISDANRVNANLEKNLTGVSAMCYGIVNSHKPQMSDLAVLNAYARGTIVLNRNDADTIFDTDTTKPIIKCERYIEIQDENGNIVGNRVETIEKEKECRIITPYDLDIWMGEML